MVNYALAHIDLSFNGISCKGAAALGLGLSENKAIKNIQVSPRIASQQIIVDDDLRKYEKWFTSARL